MMKRYLPFDALKGLAILGVILIHVSGYYMIVGAPAVVLNQVGRFAVPVFLILSGWGLTITDSLKNGYGNFLIKRSRKILPLYLSWSVIYFALHILRGSIKLNLKTMVQVFIFGSSEYHMYYVPLLFFLYITYPFFLRVSRYGFGVFSTLVVTLLSMYVSIFNGSLSWWGGPNVFSWIVYFSFGIWIGLNFDKVTPRLRSVRIRFILGVLMILSFALLLLEMKLLRGITSLKIVDLMTSMKGSVIIYSIIMVMIFMSWNITTRLLIKIGKHAYGIYLFHPLLLMVLNRIIGGRSSIIIMLLEYIATVVIAYCLTKIAVSLQRTLKERIG